LESSTSLEGEFDRLALGLRFCDKELFSLIIVVFIIPATFWNKLDYWEYTAELCYFPIDCPPSEIGWMTESMAEFLPLGHSLQSKFTQTLKREDQKDFVFCPIPLMESSLAASQALHGASS